MDYVRVPKYNPKNHHHKRLSDLSKKAHDLTAEGRMEELHNVEREIDRLVAQLYSLTDEELREIKKCLAILEGKEIEEEEVEEVELPPSMPDISLKNNVVEEGKPFGVDVVISNPLGEPLDNVSVNLRLFDNRLIEKSFQEVKGEVSFPLNFEGLKAGEYKIKATFEYVVKNVPKKVEKELAIYVKGSEVKHVERSFKPEELFGE